MFTVKYFNLCLGYRCFNIHCRRYTYIPRTIFRDKMRLHQVTLLRNILQALTTSRMVFLPHGCSFFLPLSIFTTASSLLDTSLYFLYYTFHMNDKTNRKIMHFYIKIFLDIKSTEMSKN